jgi:hypothetical protein
MHLERRERVDVHARNRLANRGADLQVRSTGETRLDPALHAHLGGAAIPGLARAPRDLVHRQRVGPATQVLAQLPFRERTELTLEVADVGVVDVAADDIRDDVATGFSTERIGSGAYLRVLATSRPEQPNEVALRERRVFAYARQDRCDLP